VATGDVRRSERGWLRPGPHAGSGPPVWPRGLHFGFLLGDDVEAVLGLHSRLLADGVPIVESIFQPRFAVFKFLDPDGYVIELEAGTPSFE
jgi:hypothetical protein